jgi:FimV-like protein
LVVAVAHRDDQILKLDLARAYADMGEIAAARELLTQVRAYLDSARKPALDDHTHG